MITAKELISKLKLEAHPEGGFYTRTHLSENEHFSSILFLLMENNFSAFHRIASDEQWNWYCGDKIILHEIDAKGNYQQIILSDENLNFQYVVKGGSWFASECIGTNGFALCGCTVIPAFNFNAFELGNRETLIQQFPTYSEIIKRLTR